MAGGGKGCNDQSVNQVMATAAALIAAKKAKEKEAAMREEAAMRAEAVEREQKRQLQQREMTPDNLRIVEQKLLQFQKQQQEDTGDMETSVQETFNQEAGQYHQQQQVYHQEQAQVQQQFQQSFQSYEQTFSQQESVMQQQSFVQNQDQSFTHSQQQNVVQEQSFAQNQQQNMIQQQSYVQNQQHQNVMEEHNFIQQQNFVQQQSSVHQQQYQIQELQHYKQQMTQEQYLQQENQNNSQSYLSAIPQDGSMPYRTNPIGDPVTKRSQSVAATPDREIKRKWSISASTDYLNKTNKDNYMVRNNPIGLAEPSVKRDGYAVGSREGSVYRSSGNVNVTSGNSRAGSELRDAPPGGWQPGRRASTSDIKGSGIRTGGNLVEPSVKSQNFCMPFGSAKANGGFMKKRSKQVVQNQNAQQITESKLQAKRERNRTISGETTSKMTTTTMHQHQSEFSSSTTYQIGSALSGITSALQQIEVNETKQNVTMPMPRKGRRAQSLPRGQVSNEESSFKVSLPGSARTSRQASVEPDHKRKTLSRHGSVEIFDGSYNLTVPNKLSRHASTSKLEEIHTDHIKILGELETENDQNKDSSEISKEIQNESPGTNAAVCTSVHQKQESQIQESSTNLATSYQQSQASAAMMSSQNTLSTSSSKTTTSQSSTSVQKSETYSESFSSCEQSSSSQISQQLSMKGQTSQRSRHVSSTNDTVVSGQKFNISNGLKRPSQEDVRRSRHVSGAVENGVNGVGSALKGLDTALEQIAAQQRKEETQFVAKVSSRQTSKRGSVSVSAEDANDVTNVMVSLPASRSTSRTTSRRNSIDLGNKGRRSRRGSLDIYTAEYALKLGNQKNITNMQQKNSFHMKVDDKNENNLNLCGRCHLPNCKTETCTEYGDNCCPRCLAWDHWEDTCWTQDSPVHVCATCNYEGHAEEVHTAEKFTQRRACVDTLGWEPFQEWFYNNEFRSWWQVMGCVGVPLYKIYPRKTQWKTVRPKESLEDATDKKIVRNDSVDDMIAQVLNKK